MHLLSIAPRKWDEFAWAGTTLAIQNPTDVWVTQWPVQTACSVQAAVIFGRGAPEKTPMAEHIKNIDGHGPKKPSMAAGDCVPDTTTNAIFGGLST